MTLVLDRRRSAERFEPAVRVSTGFDGFQGAAPRDVLHIGLVNNMPDAALRATERQFIALLADAADTVTVRLHFFALPGIARGPGAEAHLRRHYGGIDDLSRHRLDALIVTGSEPKAASLRDEPYWDELAALVDHAERETISTLWSCLAAHAAVLHLDGIGRHRLAEKRFGLFECVKVAEHSLLDGTPTAMRVPHSRWNDLKESELRAHGYRILTRSFEAGVDTFARQGRSLFVFFQGHPEYAPDTLFREYRRDVQRFLAGERSDMPRTPRHYFDARSEHAFEGFAAGARANPDAGALTGLPQAWAPRAALIDLWRGSAVRFYRNWLHRVASARAGTMAPAGTGADAISARPGGSPTP